MRTAAFLLAGALAVTALAPVRADEEDHASAHVFTYVDPNMAVSPLDIAVDMGSVQTGAVLGVVPFRVDSNCQCVKFMASASDLWKGNDPYNTDVDPIPLDLGVNVEFDCENANPTGGAGPGVPLNPGRIVDCDGFPALETDWLTFESSQNNQFSQVCAIEVTWNQHDPEKPMGEYSGCVGFWALICLPG